MKISKRALALGMGVMLPAMAARAATPADLLLYNGKVITADARFTVKSAVVVSGGRIVAVGGPELRQRYSAARTIDLRGRTQLPGFTDTHLHPYGTSPRDVDAAAARSIGELQDMLAALERGLSELPAADEND